MLQDTLKPVRFDPKSQQYKLAVMRFYGFLTGKLALTKNVVKCISYTPGIYTVASATDVWTDHKVVHMHRLGDCWACDCESKSLCWHIAAACATHYFDNTDYNPVNILQGMLADRNKKAQAQVETPHDPHSNHSSDCQGCLQAAGNPDTSHWSAGHNFWACSKNWALGYCGGRAVSIGGYCATCAQAGWDDLQSGR